jgi:hypothetical protein
MMLTKDKLDFGPWEQIRRVSTASTAAGLRPMGADSQEACPLMTALAGHDRALDESVSQ